MNKQFIKIAAKVTLTFCLLCFLPAHAGWQPYDWLVTIETEGISGQFEYAGSTLKPVVLARISYARADGSDNTNYQTLWYCNGKPFGLERAGSLNVNPGQGVAMQIIHKTNPPTSGDYAAAANSILRIYLDIRVNQSMPCAIIVPDQSFDQIITDLTKQHFALLNSQLETPYQTGATLFLQDSSNQRNQTLYQLSDTSPNQ
jgi:hypothetical protein